MDDPNTPHRRPAGGGGPADEDRPPSRIDADRALYQEIGRRLRYHREALGVTEEWMASRIGVSNSHYHRYETGERRIPLADFVLAARALGQTASGMIEVIPGAPELPERRAPLRQPLELLRELERAMPVLLEEVAVDDLVVGVRRSAVAAALRPQRSWAYQRRVEELEDRLVAVRVGNREGEPRLRIDEIAILNLDALPGPRDVVLTSTGHWRELIVRGAGFVMSPLNGPPVAHGERPIGVVRQLLRLV